MHIDLANVSKALQTLRSEHGQKVMKEVHEQLGQFRKQIGVDLNDAEFRHVMQTLFAQQVVSGNAAVTLENVGGGFQVRRPTESLAVSGADVI
jgi:hypothetical protein